MEAFFNSAATTKHLPRFIFFDDWKVHEAFLLNPAVVLVVFGHGVALQQYCECIRSIGSITVDDVLPVIRQGLELPSEARVEIALTGFKPVAVPVADQAAPTILHIDRPSHGSEHFTARLEVSSASGGQRTAFNVSGTMTMEIRAVTLRHAMHLGQPILPEDVAITFVRIGLIPDDALQSPEDAIGLEARGVLAVGQVLSVSELAHPQLVHRGSIA